MGAQEGLFDFGHSRGGLIREELSFFKKLDEKDIKYDSFIFVDSTYNFTSQYINLTQFYAKPYQNEKQVCLIKVTLQHALMSTESGFSEILRFRNLLIALQPIGVSKFCKKYWIAHILGNRKTYLT